MPLEHRRAVNVRSCENAEERLYLHLRDLGRTSWGILKREGVEESWEKRILSRGSILSQGEPARGVTQAGRSRIKLSGICLEKIDLYVVQASLPALQKVTRSSSEFMQRRSKSIMVGH